MEDFDVREIRYFLAVAEERNFSRAAARLGMSQPPLSRAIKRMERRLGAPLFERGHRALRLTAAGLTLRDEGRKVLEVVSAATRRTRRAARAAPALTATAEPGRGTEVLRRIVDAYTSLPGAPAAAIAVSGYRAPAAAVRGGHADIAVISTPYDRRGLAVLPLLEERRVAAVPAGHPLAARAELRCADLAGEPFPRWPDDTGAARRYVTGQDRADADPADPGDSAEAPVGPLVNDMQQLLEVVGLGQALALVPHHVAERNPRADVVYLPVADASPYAMALAWPDDPSGLLCPAVDLFVKTAIEVVGAPRDSLRGTAPA
ncbi:LysR family transcriptional regulator [Streptomonospora nanhaiensis]|uniref:DNA-binding transcriptional LysR family regulator n=1 Tax=Streptomonospora nanhaiensis TaxID=1323731 RepID=A0A853BMG6_9ACTN|nr:LysR family transcriptional regulator [Streptomonospora nanhaiensis]MBX9388732.1 LysR family transcriptional regulator [Streptomonospora nanhaiensis]NYI96779.1 DNA-binding transcriptional LysR family regulator [Streptomonospora nanhaiensis]